MRIGSVGILRPKGAFLLEPRIEEGKNEPVAVGAERIDQADLKPRARIGDVDQTELHALQFIRPGTKSTPRPAEIPQTSNGSFSASSKSSEKAHVNRTCRTSRSAPEEAFSNRTARSDFSANAALANRSKRVVSRPFMSRRLSRRTKGRQVAETLPLLSNLISGGS